MSEITKKLLENTSKPLGAPALLVLEDGAVFSGTSCAAQGEVFGEICFNTSLEGYLEVITDPSYAGQIITMTYPQIGNYGVNREDCQSEKPALRGLVVQRYVSGALELARELTLPTSCVRTTSSPSRACRQPRAPRSSRARQWCPARGALHAPHRR